MPRWSVLQQRSPIRRYGSALVAALASPIAARLERERAALADARAARERLQATLESITDAFFSVDREWRYTYLNARAAQMLGRPRDDLLGEVIWEAFPQAARTPIAEEYRRAMAEQVPRRLEYVSPTLQIWVEVHVYPSREGLAVYFQDVDERKRGEEALRTSEDRLRLAVSAARIGHFEIDWIERRREWSPELRAMLAVPDDVDIAADTGLIDRIIPAEHIARYRAALAGSLDPRGSGEYEDEHEVLKLDGSRAWMLIRGKTFFESGPDGPRPARTIGLMMDITERKRAEETEHRLYEQAQDAIRTRDEFISLVGHELRNPLASVKGHAQLMQRRGAYNERSVQSIVAQTDQLARLIDDLLTVSRLESGALTLRLEPLDLVARVRDCADEAQTTSDRHTIRVERPDEPLVGSWDPDRLSQVFRNLLGNAVKYSPEGGEIVVRIASRAGAADVSIRDQGVGIGPEALGRLFERFYRADDVSGSTQGFGLGLYITRELVEAHGGHIWAESDGPGQGSTFHVSLPYRPAAADPPAPDAGGVSLDQGA